MYIDDGTNKPLKIKINPLSKLKDQLRNCDQALTLIKSEAVMDRPNVPIFPTHFGYFIDWQFLPFDCYLQKLDQIIVWPPLTFCNLQRIFAALVLC